MDTKMSSVPKQMLDFNKAAFDKALNAMISLQSQNEKVASDFMDKAEWFPENSKKTFLTLVKSYNKGLEELKNAADGSFNAIAEFLADKYAEPSSPKRGSKS
jgi:hypothetical protein